MSGEMREIIFDIETTGLDSLFDRIICVCVSDISNNGDARCFYGKDEEKILNDLFNYLNNGEPIRLYGYNSDSFDIPFIIRRCVVHGIKIPSFTTRDLRKIANGFSYSYNKMETGKLRDWATVFGIKIDTSNGSEMFKLYSEDKFDEIKEHCLEDIKVTTKLCSQVKKCGLVY